MKQIIALLAVALVGLAACKKWDARIDGTYRSDARQEIIISGGACISFQENYATGEPAVKLTSFNTSGSWPDYVFSATNQTDLSQVGAITNFTIQAHFINADTFTAVAGGIITAGGVSTAIPPDRQFTFIRISANSKQTNN